MGGHSYYCAICGGPFGDIAFSPPHPDAENTENPTRPDDEESHPDSPDEDENDPDPVNPDDLAWSGPEDSEDDESQADQSTDSSDTESDPPGSEHDTIELSDNEAEDAEVSGVNAQSNDDDLSEDPSEDSQEDTNIGLDDIVPSEGSFDSQDDLMLSEHRFDDNHWDEEPGAAYDRKILKPRHAHWIKTLYAFGCNLEAPGPSKCYLSGRGFAEFNEGTVWFTPGPIRRRDPNYPRTNGRRRAMAHIAYCDWSHQDTNGWVFPVHMPCLKVLCQVLTGRPDVYENPKLDKDALFLTFDALAEYLGGALNITYFPDQTRIPQFWESVPGNEYIHANPLFMESRKPKRVLHLVLDAIKTSHDRRYLLTDLTHKVKSDRFSKLPYDLIYDITRLLPDQDLFSFCSASYIVHKHLGQNQKFWRHRLTKVSMPWFEEALVILSRSDSEEMLKVKDWKGVMCAWQELLSSEKYGKQGLLMGVYNRRRIWGCCQVIAREYFKKVKEVKERGVEALVKELEGFSGRPNLSG
ncbi:hypothetical protein B0T21DRAFT_352294 [Apiosordaria backusii]|uniref:F-box domain-containing protein n=1 Tax=Apiosordaria backusii TaxID=314023 RepID=A0AA40AEF6_9PEZI|nr:hypothetical protein B0T21DRAFT_352294 [Apiosordaria backusii]